MAVMKDTTHYHTLWGQNCDSTQLLLSAGFSSPCPKDMTEGKLTVVA